MPASRQRPKFVVVVFDGLRRDMLTPALAPNITTFIAGGCDFPRSRSVFPTETRVNTTSLASGARPTRHGIVANAFIDPTLPGAELFDTSNLERLALAERIYEGRIVTATQMGEVMAGAGLKQASVSTGTVGNARLINARASVLGHATFSVHGVDASTAAAGYAAVAARLGPTPAKTMPGEALVRYGTDVLLAHILPEHAPDVATLWYAEPDTTYHYRGVGSEASRAATAAVDREFGRVLDWWRGSPEHDRIQIVAMSDHGHVVSRGRIDLMAEMKAAGFRAGKRLQPDIDVVIVPGYCSKIRVRDGDPALMVRLAAWLREQPWCGMLFAAPRNEVEGVVEGTFSRALAGADHERAPDLYLVLRTDDDTAEDGIPGGCWTDNPDIPVGGGVHGGLHPLELNNLLSAQGSLFREGFVSDMPCGIIDIAPTILAALGLERPAGMEGRVLGEALTHGAADAGGRRTDVETGAGDYRQTLRFSSVGRVVYLDGGKRAD
ncbi:MAG: alkaline phosphatase family protein [Acetobacterales bacterium]